MGATVHITNLKAHRARRWNARVVAIAMAAFSTGLLVTLQATAGHSAGATAFVGEPPAAQAQRLAA